MTFDVEEEEEEENEAAFFNRRKWRKRIKRKKMRHFSTGEREEWTKTVWDWAW